MPRVTKNTHTGPPKSAKKAPRRLPGDPKEAQGGPQKAQGSPQSTKRPKKDLRDPKMGQNGLKSLQEAKQLKNNEKPRKTHGFLAPNGPGKSDYPSQNSSFKHIFLKNSVFTREVVRFFENPQNRPPQRIKDSH